MSIFISDIYIYIYIDIYTVINNVLISYYYAVYHLNHPNRHRSRNAQFNKQSNYTVPLAQACWSRLQPDIPLTSRMDSVRKLSGVTLPFTFHIWRACEWLDVSEWLIFSDIRRYLQPFSGLKSVDRLHFG